MEEVSNSIPIGLQTLLSDLNFLSQIRRDTKPCCNDRILVDASSWAGSFYRFIKGENRNNVVSQVEKIVAHTIDAIDRYQNTDHIKIIVNYFSDAREGIAALLIVYSTDPNITAKIRVQIDLIDIQLKRFRNLIKGYAENKHVEPVEARPEVKEDKIEVKQEKPIEIKMTEEPLEEKFPGLSLENNTIDLLDSSETEKKKFRRNKIKIAEKLA